MFESLGSKKYALPALIVVVVGCVLALMFTPMVKMSPKNLPFAVLSLDEGFTTPQGEVNAGEKVVESLVNADAEDAPIAWEVVDSQQELDDALENNEYFGALTIPADFTQGQAMAQAGHGEAPAVDVVLDNAKSPMIATQMQSQVQSMFGELGIPATVELIHTGKGDSSSASPMAGMMTQQLTVMPLMIMSMIGGILLTRIFPKSNEMDARGRFATLGKQLAYAVPLSLLAAVTTVVLLNTLVAAEAPFWTTSVFLWVASFVVMALFLGAFNIAVPLGALAVLVVTLCGMMTGALPAEVLPAFWADWLAPWVPQPFITLGVRDILYMEAGLMPRGTGALVIIGAAGLVLAAISGLIPGRRKVDVG